MRYYGRITPFFVTFGNRTFDPFSFEAVEPMDYWSGNGERREGSVAQFGGVKYSLSNHNPQEVIAKIKEAIESGEDR